MVKVARYLRTIFGLEALLFLLAIPSLLVVSSPLEEDASHMGRSPVTWIGIALVALSFVSGMAWWSLRKGRGTARAWAITASVWNLLLIPIGTAIGIAGLMAFWPRHVAAQVAVSAQKHRQPVPGDGTHKHSIDLFLLLYFVSLTLGRNWWSAWAQKQGLPTQPYWFWALEVEAAILINVLCHEMGHVLAGWKADMKLRTLVVGPLRLELRAGKWRCKFKWMGLLGEGAAGMVPTHLDDVRSRRLFMIAAGPVASMMTFLFATAVALSAPGNPWAPTWEFFATLSTLAGIAAVTNCIPVRPENEYSDGAQIYQLLSTGPWAEFYMAFAMVSSSLVTPLRPRDFDTGVLMRAAAFMNTGMRGMLLNLYLCMHHMDRGQRAEAVRWLDAAESIYPQVADKVEADLHAEFAFFNATCRQDLAAAQSWWQRVEEKGNSRCEADYWKARAAVRWMEGAIGDAYESLRRADALARQLPAAGAYEYDREQIAHLSALFNAPSYAAERQAV